MATEEKKTPEKEPVKVTSGKDFVAVKPEAAKEKPAETAKDIKRDEEDLAEHQARMQKLEREFEERKEALAAEEAKLRRESQERLEKERAYNEEQAAIAAAAASRSNELGKAHFAGDNVTRQYPDPSRVPERDPDHPTNARGTPIPVAEQNQRVRHISEVGGDNYNGKSDTLPEGS